MLIATIHTDNPSLHAALLATIVDLAGTKELTGLYLEHDSSGTRIVAPAKPRFIITDTTLTLTPTDTITEHEADEEMDPEPEPQDQPPVDTKPAPAPTPDGTETCVECGDRFRTRRAVSDHIRTHHWDIVIDIYANDGITGLTDTYGISNSTAYNWAATIQGNAA